VNGTTKGYSGELLECGDEILGYEIREYIDELRIA
jgi:hypothetical protein